MNLNKAMLIGRVTRLPEMRATESGTQIVNFSLATNNTYKDKEGQKHEQVEFHHCVAFGRRAEVIAQYVMAGQLLMVEGRLHTNSWEGEDGQKRYRTEIVVDNFQFGPKSSSPKKGELTKEAKETIARKEAEKVEYPDEDGIDISNIPF